MLTEKETIELLDEYINESGLWLEFLAFIEEKGYKKEELNMETD